MKKTFLTLRLVLGSAVTVLAVAASHAQQPAGEPADRAAASAEGDGWYYRPVVERDANLTVVQQKAMARGAQRMARLEAMRWYGFSNSRPTASAIPWTTMYSPAWQQPGGRPFAWHVSARPVVVITQPVVATDYR